MAKFIIDVTDDERKNLLHMIGQAVFKGNECFVYVDMFQKLRIAWRSTTGAPALPIANAAKTIRRKTPKVAPAKLG
jgi:hypothetical protein